MRRNFTLAYLILVVAQVLICNYFHVTQYVMLSILPAMILCLPPKCGTTASLLIAFVTGLAVDFLADGVPGLNAMALLPVAMLRLPVIRICLLRLELNPLWTAHSNSSTDTTHSSVHRIASTTSISAE